MKKVISLVSSAALALAVTFSAAAAPQTARKLTKGTRAIQRTLDAKPTAQSRMHVLSARSAHNPAAPSLKRAMAAVRMGGTAKHAAAAAATDLPQLRGSVIFQDGWNDNYQPIGMYDINSDGTAQMLVEGVNASYGGVEVDGLYYATEAVSFWGMMLVTVNVWDLEAGEKVNSFDGEVDNVCMGETVDPTTGTVYAITYNAAGDGAQLSKMSYTESSVTTTAIAPLEGNWNSLVCDAQGQLYAISYEGESQGDSYIVLSSALNKIDKTTGTVTPIGDTGHVPQYISSATIDTKTGRMFWVVNPADGSGYLCEVNLATGAATKVLDLALNDEVMALHVPAPLAEAGAPAVVTDLSAEFPEGALSGTVRFKLPSALYDGTPATGNVGYAVLAEGVKKAEGQGAYGANVSVPVTVDAAGQYTISVSASNAVGEGPKAKLKLYIGQGTPISTTATLVYEGGKMKLSWTPVTETVDGGYMDPEVVTYTVTRILNNESSSAMTVATGIKGTSWEEEVEVPDEMVSYHYLVTACNGTVMSVPAQTNAVALGNLLPPYSNSFSSSGALAGYTVIDANEDGKKWEVAVGAVGADGEPGAAKMTYNTNMAMDDWMITPPVKLQGGKAYKVTFMAANNGANYIERLEAKWGGVPTVAGMTNTLVEATDITGAKTYMELGGYIVPEADGVYYVGIHGISDKDKYYLYVDDLTISAATSMAVPGKATDFAVAKAADGSVKATVSFTTPSVTMGGDPLAELTKVVLSRDGEAIKTFDAPATGTKLTHEDVPAESGMHEYSVQCFNSEGAGEAVKASVFVGVDKPAAPANVKLVETANPGEVTITWDAVSTDQYGELINPSLVKYYVCEPQNTGYGTSWVPLFEEPITATTYTFQAVEAGKQDFVQYGVFAETSAGTGQGGPTDLVAVGTPYTGIEESFADGSLAYAWATGYSANGGAWGIYTDEDNLLISQDDDNGYAAMKASGIGSTSGLFTAKVSLAGIESPGVSYYTYNIIGESGESDDINEMAVYVKEASAAEWPETPVSNMVINTLSDEDGWQLVNVSLAAYAGKVVQVRFQATAQKYIYTAIDNIKIGELTANDVAARGISAPGKVAPGSKYNVDVTVGNVGTADASAITVELYADDKLAETKTLDALESGKNAVVSFECDMHVLAEEAVAYHAVVKNAADENDNNNTTKTIEVAPVVSRLPAVTDLKGENGTEGVKLTWSEPDLSSVAEEKTVDFEDAEAWAHEYAGWTFVDADGKPVGGFQNTEIPGIEAGVTLTSFFVFEQDGATFNQTFAAHSGNKFLASLFNYDPDGGMVDDWAISPALDGSAQTVSFWAKSYDSNYPESFDILYSTGSLDTKDFVKVKEVKNAPKEWTEYTFDVPEGAKHFAIRNHDTDAFMLMLDDFTFATAGSSAKLSIVGYDVYRDGEKITAEPTGETKFVDADAADGEHTYVVVTVYETGMSKGSNAVNVTATGIDDALAAGITVTGENGHIVVAGAEGKLLSIAAIDGRLVYNATASAKVSVSVATGVYVVKAGDTIVKVAVK